MSGLSRPSTDLPQITPSVHFENTLTSRLFEDYLNCPTKCFLHASLEKETENTYANWAETLNQSYRREGLTRLASGFSPEHVAVDLSIAKQLASVSWQLTINLVVRANNLEANIDAVERLLPRSRDEAVRLVPIRFISANKLTRNNKLILAFDALALSTISGSPVDMGTIVHGDSYAMAKVKTSELTREVRKRIGRIGVMLSNRVPPKLVLNRHCPECVFQARCRKTATENNDLSLLGGMSEREISKLNTKGIFSVTQLSYTFRPRRRRHELPKRQEKFHHSLRALAIRENKIHAVDLPNLTLDGTPVYLDVEGLPDCDFYYLIGVRIITDKGAVQHSFWANNADDEKQIWIDFLTVLSEIPDPRIVHYGSYETTFLKRMGQLYGTPCDVSAAASTAIAQPVNILSLIFARIYFPTFSNGLKEVAGYFGFSWSGAPSSGLESIMWRRRWEQSSDSSEKQALLDYNQQDCEALEIVTGKIVELYCAARSDGPQRHVVRTSDMKREGQFGFKRVNFVLPELKTINEAAYWDYQRERVYIRSRHRSIPKKKRRTRRTRVAIKPNAVIECMRPRSCPSCKSTKMFGHGKRSKTVIDLHFMQHGIKRWIVRYAAHRYKCTSCKRTFNPRDKRWPSKKYGSNLIAYAIYLNIELRIPQEQVTSNLNKVFSLGLGLGVTHTFKSGVAEAYRDTYDGIVKRLCSGRLLHADETHISVKGRDGFVWVLTSMEEVAYFYTPTREGSTIQTMLKKFSGVLVSDFYAAYDSISCFQQKCLIHLIRDLNDELLKHPYDDGLSKLAKEFTALVKPIIETVDRRGLKKRFLGKHLVFVDRFYKRIAGEVGASESVRKVIDRLQKNRETLFTFLGFDDVPWNNNNAEHAVKAFATLRRVIDGTTSENGLRDYLILLSLCETCKYQGLDFLEFMRSGIKDIPEYARAKGASRPRR